MSRGAEVQRGGGAREQRSWGAEEQRCGGEFTPAPQHPCTPAPEPPMPPEWGAIRGANPPYGGRVGGLRPVMGCCSPRLGLAAPGDKEVRKGPRHTAFTPGQLAQQPRQFLIGHTARLCARNIPAPVAFSPFGWPGLHHRETIDEGKGFGAGRLIPLYQLSQAMHRLRPCDS